MVKAAMSLGSGLSSSHGGCKKEKRIISAKQGRRWTEKVSRCDSSALLLLLFLSTRPVKWVGWVGASIAFVFFVVPPFLTLSSQIFGPRSVEESLDSLKLVLVFVLFAIVWGLLSRSDPRGDGGSSSSCPWLDSPGRMKTSSSYPDPRAQDSPRDCSEGRQRFDDDTHLVAGRVFGSEPVDSGGRWKKFETERVVADDSLHRNTAVEDEVDKPPAAPPKPAFHPMEESNGGKRERDRKKQRKKSIENLESLLASQPPPSSSHLRPAVAAQRKTRAKPPPFSQSTANLININKSRTPLTTTPNYESSDDSINSGSQSPSILIPPSPPPLKVEPWNFDWYCEHLGINSTNTWRHGMPDTKSDEASVSGMNGSPGNASLEEMSPAFCSSPDVDVKAHNFIVKIRYELKQEMMNSMKKRRSNLAP
ncbi:hypothetical protein BT93_F2571 [Corymbia citriodora subsp. variegata]|nr:hypothetical protein BT93_F2571 [Corymbia citriodora subsp. variegata]